MKKRVNVKKMFNDYNGETDFILWSSKKKNTGKSVKWVPLSFLENEADESLNLEA